jgi:hypothetical protein
MVNFPVSVTGPTYGKVNFLLCRNGYEPWVRAQAMKIANNPLGSLPLWEGEGALS